MFSPMVHRSLGTLALVACAPLVVGCSSTRRYVVDSEVASNLEIESAYTSGSNGWLVFDQAGGVIDPTAGMIRGTRSNGKTANVPLKKVSRLYFQGWDGERAATINGHPAALLEGASWRPDGRIQKIIMRSGLMIDMRDVSRPASIDALARVVRYEPAGKPTVEVPFNEIQYVQMKDTHPGRTILLITGIGLVGFAAGLAIAIHHEGIGL